MSHTSTTDPTIYTRHIPVQEIKLVEGTLLSASPPRYSSLGEYAAQLTQMSCLKHTGLYLFHDPITPALMILVRTRAEEACRRCSLALEDCPCPF
jgi:hypothetical protein